MWDQALACQGSQHFTQPRSDGDSQSKATRETFGASGHSKHGEDKLCFIRCSSDKVLAVLEDQATRGQVIKMTEHEARQRYPDLVIASIGTKEKTNPGEPYQPGTF